MKAILLTQYGSPDILQFKEVEKPVPKDGEILVKIHAASANPLDWHLMRGAPFLARLAGGLRKPKDPRLGADIAGRVESVGNNVTQFQPGDEVFGAWTGSFAEHAAVPENRLALKPTNSSFEEAAAVPVAAITALQGLRDKGQIQSGQKVLVNGASGGVGTFAVQIAKVFGAEVTGVCSTRNVDLVRSIGADHVIDYTQEDFTRNGQHYDLIYDTVGNRSVSDRQRVLTPNGICILAGIGGAGLHEGQLMRIAGVLKANLLSRFVRQKFVGYGTKLDKEDLKLLSDLMQTGKVTPVIDRTYKLSETAEAMRYFEEGHARGKVVIIVEQGEQAR